MRTKTLLLIAALGLASAASSVAQVYSVNVVGYINLTMAPGFNLVANPLNASPDNRLNSVLPAAVLESQVLKFANNNYSSDISDGAEWLDANTGDPSTTTVAPGDGFFFFNPAAANVAVTLVGEVKTGSSTVNLAPGFSLVSSVVPQELDLSPANGVANVLEAQYLTFNAGIQNYNGALINDGGGWLDANTGDPAVARPAVGQGFFYFNPGNAAQSWTRTFNPNN